MSRLKNKGIFVFFAALVTLYVIIYVVPKVTGLLNVTYVAEYGELSIYDDTVGCFVRDEHVYAAMVSGSVTRLAPEGRLIRIGDPAVQTEGGVVPEVSEAMTAVRDRLGSNITAVSGYYAQSGGIVSYYVDGLEAELTPDTMSEKGYDYFSAIPADTVLEIPEQVYMEYPVFKIVSSGKWYLVAFVSNDHAERYEAGRTIDLIVDPSQSMNMAEVDSDTLEMTVESSEVSGDKVKLIMSCDKWFDGMTHLRSTNVRIITTSVHGLLLEKKSIIEHDGIAGVYIKNKKGKHDFVPVHILADDGTTVAVSDSYFYDSDGTRIRTVDPFDDVLKDPDKKTDADGDAAESDGGKADGSSVSDDTEASA